MSATSMSKTEDNAIAELEAALSDLDLEEIVGDEQEALDDLEIVEEPVEADEGETEEELLAALDLELEKQEAYQKQSSAQVASIDPSVSAPIPAANAAKTGAKRASAPRIQRDLNDLAPEFFVRTGDPAQMDKAALDQAKADMIAMKPSQVKIAEKFENLFTSIAAGRLPSAYTLVAFNLLDGQKTATSAELIAAYKSNLAKCGEGTARSQTGQLMALLACVGIADRNGNTLTLRGDSTIAERLRKLSA